MSIEQPPDNSSEKQEGLNVTKREYVTNMLSQKLNKEATDKDVERVGKVASSLMEKAQSAAGQHGMEMDKRTLFKSMIDTLDEAHGNFNGVFAEDKISWDQFLNGLADEKNVQVKAVKPEEYFTDVGNGMNVETHQQAVEKTRETLQEKDPDLAKRFLANDPKVATQAILDMLDHPEYVRGILDKEMVEEGLSQGYDHIAHTRWQVEQLAKGHALAPPMVAKYKKSEEKFGAGTKKTILDGTHRTLSATYTNQPLFVIEVDVDRIKGGSK